MLPVQQASGDARIRFCPQRLRWQYNGLRVFVYCQHLLKFMLQFQQLVQGFDVLLIRLYLNHNMMVISDCYRPALVCYNEKSAQ